mgnify:FL=1
MAVTGSNVQTPGTYISAVGHTVLIGWLILGWGLDSDPFPFEVTEMSVVTGEEYAQIVAATTPQPSTAQPDTPATPLIEDAPDAPVMEAAPEVTPPPAPTEQPADETPPPVAPTPPAPPAEVEDTAPVEPAPPAPEVAALPEVVISPRPQPRPTPRIAPTPVAPPPPDAAVSEVVQDAVVPDEATPSEVVEPAVEPTAPEEAATEIAIADVAPSGAVETSPRPPARPSRPAPQTPATTTSASSDNATSAADDAAVEAALAAAMAAASSPDVPAGPPMSASEKEGFRVAVNACSNVDPGSQAARVPMTVAFSLDRAGKVLNSDVRQVSASGGDTGSTEIAFQAARRAILRCQSGGYQLPADKYDQWKDVEITFDPSGMRMR